jgi:hypothetical protein
VFVLQWCSGQTMLQTVRECYGVSVVVRVVTGRGREGSVGLCCNGAVERQCYRL